MIQRFWNRVLQHQAKPPSIGLLLLLLTAESSDEANDATVDSHRVHRNDCSTACRRSFHPPPPTSPRVLERCCRAPSSCDLQMAQPAAEVDPKALMDEAVNVVKVRGGLNGV